MILSRITSVRGLSSHPITRDAVRPGQVSGKIIPNADHIEGSSAAWRSNASGIVTGHSAESERASTVGTGDMQMLICDVGE